MLKFEYTEAVNIETENPGVLEVPEGKNVEDLPIKHFVDIANRKGLSTVTRALNNLQVWNKNKNKELSKWAGDMIDKVSKRFENQQKNESMTKESIHSYDYSEKSTIANNIAYYVFDGDVDSNLDELETLIGYLDMEDYESPETLIDRLMTFDLDTLLYVESELDVSGFNESVSSSVTLDLVEEKELAEFIDWLNEVNIPVAKVNRKFKNITLKNYDDLDEASFYLQDRDYFKKLHDFGWIVSVRA